MAKRKLPDSSDSTPRKSRAVGANTRWANDKLVSDVNLLFLNEFRALYIDDEWLSFPRSHTAVSGSFEIAFKRASGLEAHELSECFNLIESTSRRDYEASTSFGWHPSRKRLEMKEPEMRYLLVRPAHDPANCSPEDRTIKGFLSFMLTHDSTPKAPVLYIYEIHLVEPVQKLGLGAHLMEIAEKIAGRVGVQKVMLTCFLSNVKALCFYKKRGYAADECSPEDRTTRTKVVKVDYMIMSKPTIPQSDATGQRDERRSDLIQLPYTYFLPPEEKH